MEGSLVCFSYAPLYLFISDFSLMKFRIALAATKPGYNCLRSKEFTAIFTPSFNSDLTIHEAS